MALLNESGQCTCGILFEDAECGDFLQHILDGTHERCSKIQVCGPCFMGLCIKCEKARHGDAQCWKCRCMHDRPLIFNEAVVSVLSITVSWSDWLESNRMSESLLSVTEDPNYKEK
jgi:hypothetical protein